MWFGPGFSDAPLSQASGETSQLMTFSVAPFEGESQALTLALNRVGRLDYCLLINAVFSDPCLARQINVGSNKCCVTAIRSRKHFCGAFAEAVQAISTVGVFPRLLNQDNENRPFGERYRWEERFDRGVQEVPQTYGSGFCNCHAMKGI